MVCDPVAREGMLVEPGSQELTILIISSEKSMVIDLYTGSDTGGDGMNS